MTSGLVFAVDLARKPVALPPIVGGSSPGGHLLVAGATGAGKSSVINALIGAGVLEMERTRLLALVGVDLKRVELSPWMSALSALATDADSADDLLTRLVRLMQARYRLMEVRGWRSWLPTSDAPLILLIVDELAEVSAEDGSQADPKGSRQRRIAALERLSRLARAAGIQLVLATQRPATEVISSELRSNCLWRLCLRVPNKDQAKMALGEIPAGCEPWGRLQPGAGYLLGGIRDPARRVRALWWSDERIAALAAAVQAHPLPELAEPDDAEEQDEHRVVHDLRAVRR